jgi:[ribosomal protein S18]-alanine N-acetyltransferase
MMRLMHTADWETVADLLASVAESAHWTTKDLSELERAGVELRVCTETGQLTGIVAWREAVDEAEVLNVAVAPAWRRKGIATEMMNTAIEETRATGVRRVFLEVRESNAGAQAFYRRLGFAEAGRRRKYYNDPAEDALLLSLELQP